MAVICGLRGHRYQEPVDTPVSEMFNVDDFPFIIIVTLSDDHVLAVLIGDLFNPINRLGEELLATSDTRTPIDYFSDFLNLALSDLSDS
jgi:hypothetical protein